MNYERLVIDNYNLIWHVIHKNSHLLISCTEEDLLSEGHLALISAAKTYNVDKGNTFSTYACKCIYNRLSRYNEQQIIRKNKCQTISMDYAFEYGANREHDLFLKDTLVSNDFKNLNEKYDLDYLFLALEYTMVKYGTINECKAILLKLLGKNQDYSAKIIGVKQASCSRLLTKFTKKLKYVVDNDEHKNYEGLIKSDFVDIELYIKTLYKNIRGKINGSNGKRTKSPRKNYESNTKVRRVCV